MVQPANGQVGVGTVLGETYEITELVGQGGMGAVWAARHLRLPGKRVAVKVLLAGITGSSEAFARFRREAEIASRLGHKNIVEVLDFNVLPNGTPYLVLEFLQGEDLAGRLRRGPLPLDATLAITRQIASALHAAHREQVVHRDLKPENVFLCPSEVGGVAVDHVKVLDFGISKIRGSTTLQTQEQRIMGTPQYMSPEQATGKNSIVDQRTDVFALGAIVYEMLTGRPAFGGENLAEVVFKVVYEKPAPLAEVAPSTPPQVVAAVERALEKDPANRFPDMSAFMTALSGRGLITVDSQPGAAKPATGEAYASTMASQRGEKSADALASTVASQDVPAPAPRPAAPTPPPVAVVNRTVDGPARGGGAKWIAVAGLLAAAIGVTWYLARKDDDGGATATAGGGATQQTRVQETTPPAAAPDAAPARAGATPPDAGAPPVVAAANLAPDAGATRDKPTPKPRPVESDTDADADADADDAGGNPVKAELDEAEERLRLGNPKEAIRLARHSLTVKKTPRAFAIMAKAYCRMRDLGNARAQLPHLRPRQKAAVIRTCLQDGVDLR